MKILSAAVVLTALAACNTTGTPPASAQTQSQPEAPKADGHKGAEPTAESAAVEDEDDLVYEPESLTFDIRLSAALRSADNVLFLETPAGVNLNAIPDDLDKWLSRIRDKGGTVVAAPLPPDGKPNRSLLGILIDVVLFFVGLLKDEIIFSAVDDFNAVMYFDKPTGDVKWIVFTRRN